MHQYHRYGRHICISIYISMSIRFRRQTESDVTKQTRGNDKRTAATSATSRRFTSSTGAPSRPTWPTSTGAPSRPTWPTSTRLGRLLLSSTESSPRQRHRRRDLDAGIVVHPSLHFPSSTMDVYIYIYIYVYISLFTTHDRIQLDFTKERTISLKKEKENQLVQR